jgi:hypothetical protein
MVSRDGTAVATAHPSQREVIMGTAQQLTWFITGASRGFGLEMRARRWRAAIGSSPRRAIRRR